MGIANNFRPGALNLWHAMSVITSKEFCMLKARHIWLHNLCFPCTFALLTCNSDCTPYGFADKVSMVVEWRDVMSLTDCSYIQALPSHAHIDFMELQAPNRTHRNACNIFVYIFWDFTCKLSLSYTVTMTVGHSMGKHMQIRNVHICICNCLCTNCNSRPKSLLQERRGILNMAFLTDSPQLKYCVITLIQLSK